MPKKISSQIFFGATWRLSTLHDGREGYEAGKTSSGPRASGWNQAILGGSVIPPAAVRPSKCPRSRPMRRSAPAIGRKISAPMAVDQRAIMDTQPIKTNQSMMRYSGGPKPATCRFAVSVDSTKTEVSWARQVRFTSQYAYNAHATWHDFRCRTFIVCRRFSCTTERSYMKPPK